MTTGLVRSFGFAVVVAAGTLGVPAVASASLISLGASSGSFGFQTGLSPPGTVNVNTGGSGISGPATFQNDSGGYTLGITSFIVGPQSGNQFPAGSNSEPFTYTGIFPDTDMLTGTIRWSVIEDGTTPHFFGSLLVNTVSAASDAAFKATFMVGQTYGIDLITQALATTTTCLAPCTLEEVANPPAAIGASRTTAPVGSGAVTPLPGALPLLATGLGALGLLGWRRKRKAQAT